MLGKFLPSLHDTFDPLRLEGQKCHEAYISDKAGVWQQQLRNAMGEQGNMLSGSFSNSLTQYRDFFFAFTTLSDWAPVHNTVLLYSYW